MSCFANEMGISEIKFKQNIVCMCPIGKQYCTYQMYVEMVPDEVIPDYIEVGKWMGSMNAKSYTLEDATAEVFDYIGNEYMPLELKVTCKCDDAAHMPVTVVKEGARR